MTNITLLNDEELIGHVYKNSVSLDKPAQITDWSTWKQWMDSTHQLSVHGQMAYRITHLHNQILNGGLQQYFDNRYGIFAFETLDDLIEIGAQKAWQILAKAINLINPESFTGQTFYDYVYEMNYESNIKSLSSGLNELDTSYYNLDDASHPIPKLADYFRKNL